ncbi:hypothetical protein BGX34_007789, partial [Mortierella sp. NVP85]
MPGGQVQTIEIASLDGDQVVVLRDIERLVPEASGKVSLEYQGNPVDLLKDSDGQL